MRPVSGAIVAAGTMALAVWFSGAGAASAPPAAEAISVPAPHAKGADKSAAAAAAALQLRYLGVSSCAAAACHGGPVSAGEGEKWRSAYTVWATLDRHSRAFSVLFEPRSKRIVQLLDHLPSSEHAQPHKDERCLACHSAGQDSRSTPSSILADGVGCELCHGPAKNWLELHTQRAWLDSRERKFEPLPDMTDTRDLLHRAQACAACHVGSPAENGHPARDVNHDLIAAGHPRLNFEFHAYLGAMPKHWTDAPAIKPKYKIDSETHAAAWAIGQAVSAEAALNLMAARAAAAAKPAKDAAAETSSPARWPEFSEFDCYACHHQLSKKFPSNRQKAAETNPGHGRPGALPSNAWYFASAPLLLNAKVLASDDQHHEDALSKLADGAWSLGSAASIAHRNAAEAAVVMHRLTGASANMTWDHAAVERLLSRAAESFPVAPNWDAAAQRFLAVEALLAARRQERGQAGQSASSDERKIEQILQEIRSLLEFRIGSPHDLSSESKQQPTDRNLPRVDSPRGYDPAAVQTAFERLFAILRKSLPREEVK